MISISDATGHASMVQRIETLKADSHPSWGKMTVAQMLAHCQMPLRLASGELKMKRRLIGRILGGWAKKKFIDRDEPFGHDSPTDPLFRIRDECDFEQERAALIEQVKRFGENGVASSDPHPFFGPLTAADWDKLLSKHLDHHLGQFGV